MLAYTYDMKANTRNKSCKADWGKIRFEYISGNDGIRALARKDGLAPSTISSRAKKEGWEADKEKVDKACTDNIVQKAVEARGTNQEKAMDIIDSLLDKMRVAVNLIDKKDVQAMKSMVQSLKDLKELGVFETEAQETVITVKFEDGEDLAD